MADFIPFEIIEKWSAPEADIADINVAMKLLDTAITSRITELLPDRTVPVAVLLSGGLDSSIILPYVCDRPNVVSYTVSCAPSMSNDAVLAQHVSAAFNVDHRTIEPSDDQLITALRKAVSVLDTTELWEVTAGMMLLLLKQELQDDLANGAVVLTGGGADVLFPHSRSPLTNHQLQARRARDVAAKFSDSRLTPKFYELLWGVHHDRYVKLFQTEALLNTVSRFDTDLVFRRRSENLETKYCLRKLADSLGVPEQSVWAPKNPMQESSGLILRVIELTQRFLSEQNDAKTYVDPTSEPIGHSLARAGITLFSQRQSNTDHFVKNL